MIWCLPTFPTYCFSPCHSLGYSTIVTVWLWAGRTSWVHMCVHVCGCTGPLGQAHLFSHDSMSVGGLPQYIRVLVSTPLFVSFSLESDGLSFSCPGNQLQFFISTSSHRKRDRWWQGFSYLSWTFSWADVWGWVTQWGWAEECCYDNRIAHPFLAHKPFSLPLPAC